MWWLYLIAIAGGYVACIYTWPTVRAWFRGAEAEADALRAKANKIITKVRSI